MFLAIKEIKKERNRFVMVILVTALVAYLVYFLSGLSYGLAQSNVTSLEFLKDKQIALSEASNKNIYASNIQETQDNTENITLMSSVVKADVENYDLIFMGVSDVDALAPYQLIDGKNPVNEKEVVISESILKSLDVSVGDTLFLAEDNQEIIVVGIASEADYNTKPVAFTTQENLSNLFGNKRISALVFDEAVTIDSNELTILDYDDFINTIPGYQAQILTFGMMIGALILIATIVIAIFMYIITMQKKSIFGVLKVQGFSDGYIGKSVIYQTLLVTAIGIGLGIILTAITFAFIPNTVPIKINETLYVAVSVLTIGFSLIGALFSAKTILKIDPLDAI